MLFTNVILSRRLRDLTIPSCWDDINNHFIHLREFHFYPDTLSLLNYNVNALPISMPYSFKIFLLNKKNHLDTFFYRCIARWRFTQLGSGSVPMGKNSRHLEPAISFNSLTNIFTTLSVLSFLYIAIYATCLSQRTCVTSSIIPAIRYKESIIFFNALYVFSQMSQKNSWQKWDAHNM